MEFNLYEGNCLEQLKNLEDNSIDAVVTDPPYGLAFMGKKWDYDVPSIEIWKEVYRVLKPGGHLLSFGGTRTYHRMVVNIEDAGFEIRDQIQWLYGCVSEDTEILTKNGWERYNKSTNGMIFDNTQEILIYDYKNNIYKWEKPERWSSYSINEDTAYSIKSNNTDQIVSRNHNCLVERNGKLVLIKAEELESMEYMPILSDNIFNQKKKQGELLQSELLWQGEGMVDKIQQQWIGKEKSIKRIENGKEPCLEGWINVYETQGEICKSVNQICEVSKGLYNDGTKGWICNGTQINCCNGDWKSINKNGMCSSYQSQCGRQSFGKSDVIQEQCGTQEIRTRSGYKTTLATITPIKYSGIIFCPTVSTGVFVARRNGKIFITGNSGFPKSHNIGKSYDKKMGNDREVVGEKTSPDGIPYSKRQPNGWESGGSLKPDYNYTNNTLTKGTSPYEGWGTGLKPANEPICLARKPFKGTVVDCVIKNGVGGINIDDSRIGTDDNLNGGGYSKNFVGSSFLKYGGKEDYVQPTGRFPANILLDEEAAKMLDMQSGASRFFYIAKTSKKERNMGCEGMEEKSSNKNNHPTVKPINLMYYLIRLITPVGGTVLDPFMGSGSTGIAALLYGCDFVGVEMDEDYYKIARKRIDAYEDYRQFLKK